MFGKITEDQLELELEEDDTADKATVIAGINVRGFLNDIGDILLTQHIADNAVRLMVAKGNFQQLETAEEIEAEAHMAIHTSFAMWSNVTHMVNDMRMDADLMDDMADDFEDFEGELADALAGGPAEHSDD